MKVYQDLLRDIIENGVDKGDRTGTGTRSVFGRQVRFDLTKGFPLLTTKKLHFKSIAVELLWLISGSTNIKFMKDHGVTIWDEWADENGELGPVYGKQWRKWEGLDSSNTVDSSCLEYSANPRAPETFFGVKAVDQLGAVIERIKTHPDDRRLIVSAWNVADISEMNLPPCHILYQFYVADGELSCHMYQRSADSFLGVPYNIASYALLTTMVARLTGLGVGELIVSFGDLHIYSNHMEQVQEQLSRQPRELPLLGLNPREVKSIDDFTYEDFDLLGYDPHPAIKAPVAV